MNGIYAPGEEPLFENVGTSIIFKLPNGPGTLASALKCLEGIDLIHIESKPDNRGSFEFYAETGKLHKKVRFRQQKLCRSEPTIKIHKNNMNDSNTS